MSFKFINHLAISALSLITFLSIQVSSEEVKEYQLTGDKVETVEVWFSSFIPNNLSWLTKTVPKGIYKGKTGIWGFDINPTCVIDPEICTYTSLLYLDDQREFSKLGKKQSRMFSYLKYSVTEGLQVEGHTGGTTSIDTITGDVICELSNNFDPSEVESLKFKEKDKFEQSFADEDMQGVIAVLYLEIDASAKNHCTPPGTPDIDLQGTVTISVYNEETISEKRKASLRSAGEPINVFHAVVRFEGFVDTFPAFEAYVSVNGSEPVPLFQQYPESGKSPLSLYGDASIPIYTDILIFGKETY